MNHLELTGVRDVSAAAEVVVHFSHFDHTDRPGVILRESPGVGLVQFGVPDIEVVYSDGKGGGDDSVTPVLHLRLGLLA